MELMVFSVFDTKTGYYLAPFIVEHPVHAERQFERMVNDIDGGNIHYFPGDFELKFIGKFDNITGKYDQKDKIRTITNGASVRKVFDIAGQEMTLAP